MDISTTRFGSVSAENADLVHFPEGILGFSNLKSFILLDDPNDEIFAWLQSCEKPEVAFPILEPELFMDTQVFKLAKSDAEALGLKPEDKIRYFSIITIPEDPTLMTANLKAPIVVNVTSRKGRQCVLQDNDLPIREPIFPRLQQRLTHSLPIKSQAADWGVAIRLPALGKNTEKGL